jgi:hypothetical protein
LSRTPGIVLLLISAVLSGSGCLYSFTGGGLPSNIRTVAVLPFENITADPTLTQEINRAVREAVENRLGLRQAGENQADAIVRGTISRYEPDVAVGISSSVREPGQQGQVSVTRRTVQITVTVIIEDQREGRTLWERSGLMVEGEYDTAREQEGRGRERALERLITQIVEGAQSQW